MGWSERETSSSLGHFSLGCANASCPVDLPFSYVRSSIIFSRLLHQITYPPNRIRTAVSYPLTIHPVPWLRAPPTANFAVGNQFIRSFGCHAFQSETLEQIWAAS